MDQVLRASNAPGVKLLVVVQPEGSSYDVEISSLRAYGIPYVIVRSAALLEEFSSSVNLRSSPSLWIARGQSVSLSSVADLAKTILDALSVDEYQGRTIDSSKLTMSLEQALEKCAALQGVAVHVHATSPFLSKLVSGLLRLFGRRQPRFPVLLLSA